MITELIRVLEALAAQHIPTDTRHGLVELKGGTPHKPTGNGEWQPVATDTAGAWSYWRLVGDITEQAADGLTTRPATRMSVPLRYVAQVDASTPDATNRAEQGLKLLANVRTVRKALATAAGAFTATVQSQAVRLDEAAIAQQELGTTRPMPTGWQLVAIDITLELVGDGDCLATCPGDTFAVTLGTPCEIVQALTVARLLGCITEAQEAALVEELCAGGGEPCANLEIQLQDSAGNILLSGSQPDPCGYNLVLVAPDATAILRNSNGSALGATVIRSGGAEVIIAPDAQAQLVDTAEVAIGLPVPIPSNEVGVLTCPNHTAQLVDSGGNPIGEPLALVSNGNTEQTCPDAAYSVTDAEGGRLNSGTLPSNGEGVIVCPSAEYTLQDTGLNLLQSGNVLAGGSVTITAPDGEVTAQNSEATTLATSNVRSGQSLVLAIPDGNVTDSDGTPGTNPAGKAYVCTLWSTVLAGKSWAEIKAVMSAGQLAAAEADLCTPSLRFGWDAGEADTITWTILADEAGTFTTFTNDGSSGTITYSKNGGGYAALSGTVTLAAGDTITLKRTTTTGAGWAKLEA